MNTTLLSFFSVDTQKPLFLKKLLRLTGVLLFTSILTNCQSDNGTEGGTYDQHLKQSDAYHEQGQFGAALIEAKNAIQKAPDKLEAYVNIAKIYNTLGVYSEAIEALELIESDDKKTADFYFTQIEAFQKRGKLKSAKKLLDNHETTLSAQNEALFYVEKGNNQAGLGNAELALESYEKAVTTDSNFHIAYLRKGETLASLERFDELEPVIAQLEEKAPEDAEFILFKAKLAFRNNELDKGETLLTNALSYLPTTDHMTPLRANIISALASVITQQGRSTEALVYTRLLSEAYPGAQLNQSKYNDAIKAYQAGDLNEAKELLGELVEMAPNFEKARQLLGVINYLQGNYQAAQRFFDESIDPEISDERSVRLAAMNQLRLNKPKEVLKLLEQGIETSDNANNLALYGYATMSAGDESSAFRYMEKAKSLDPKNYRYYLALADFHTRKTPAEHNQALIYTRQALGIAPDEINVQKSHVRQLMLAQKSDEAKTFVTNILKKQKSDFNVHLLAGDFFLGTQSQAQAEKHYREAVNLTRSANPTALVSLGRIQLIQGKAEDALETFKKTVSATPSEAGAYFLLLKTYQRLDKLNEGIQYIENASEKTHDKTPSNDVFFAVAKAYIQLGDYSNARKYEQKLRASEENGPLIADLSTTLAYLEASQLAATGQFKPAREKVFEGLNIKSDNLALLALLTRIEIDEDKFLEAQKIIARIKPQSESAATELEGDVFRAQNKADEALQKYLVIWQTDNSDRIAQKIYAIKQTQGTGVSAQQFLNEWIEKSPNTAVPRVQRAGIKINTKDYKNAAADLESARVLAPESPTVLNNLAWVYNEMGEVDKALTLAEKASQLAPNTPEVLDTYGWILYQNNKKDQALALLERAYKLAPNNMEIKQHLESAKL